MILEIDTEGGRFYWTSPADLREYAKKTSPFAARALLSDLADQWEAKLPRLPKPRMAEPAWGEKVMAHNRLLPNRRVWLRVSTLWRDEAGALTVRWDDLIAPEPYVAEPV